MHLVPLEVLEDSMNFKQHGQFQEFGLGCSELHGGHIDEPVSGSISFIRPCAMVPLILSG